MRTKERNITVKTEAAENEVNDLLGKMLGEKLITIKRLAAKGKTDWTWTRKGRKFFHTIEFLLMSPRKHERMICLGKLINKERDKELARGNEFAERFYGQLSPVEDL